jgi:iron complex transport system substrate-binding protein
MFKFRFFYAFSVIIILGLLLAACTPAPAVAVISLTDGLNRTVTLKGPAQRVVSLAPSNTELLYEVGAGAQVVGIDDFSNFPVEARSKPSVGGSMGNYDLKAIAALKPDLVLAAQINTPEQVKALENMGLTVFYLNNPERMAGLVQNMQTVGTLTGKTGQAAALVQSLSDRITTTMEKLTAITTHYKVYYELDATDPSMPYTAGSSSYINILLEKAGDKNIAAGLTAPFAQISSEEIIKQNPDFIFLGDTTYGVTIESVMQRPGWLAISAVKNKHVYSFNNDMVSRPTARIVDAIDLLARIIHPEVFK